MNLNERLSEHLNSWPADNAAAAIVGKRTATYGEQDREFVLMSVTKLLSSYAFLMAIEEGIFELDQPAGPEGSTIRHLFAHASGMSIDGSKVQKKPEERRIYSSADFELLSELVAQEAGMTFGEYVKQGVFQPLGMHATSLWGSAGYEATSTVHDLSLFANELISPTLLAEVTVREAFTPQFPELIGTVPGYGMQKPNPWGLGFEIKGKKNPHWTGDNMPADTVGHFGMSGTYLWVVPSWSEHELAGTAMVALTDRDFGDWAKPLWQETNTAIFADLLEQ